MANLIIISGASGSGKTSLIKSVLNNIDGISLSISHTTRPIRQGEVNEVDYHFCDYDAFKADINQGKFLEYAKVFENWYGTQSSSIYTQLEQGFDVILEIDWQGAQQVRKQFSNAISISIIPPSLPELKTRLIKRGQDSKQTIERRMQDAVTEVNHYNEYDYVLINQDFSCTAKDLQSIIIATRLTYAAQIDKLNSMMVSFYD